MKSIARIENGELENVILVEDSFVCDDINYFELNSIPIGTIDNKGMIPSLTTAVVDSVKTKQDKAKQIKDERDRRGVESGYYVSSVDKWFHSDTQSRIQQLGLVMMGAGIPANLMWKTMDGSFIAMTQTLAMAVFIAAATSDTVRFTVCEQKLAALNSSSTPESYDCLAGWPQGYGE